MEHDGGDHLMADKAGIAVSRRPRP